RLDAVLDQLAQPLRGGVRADRVGEDRRRADVHPTDLGQVRVLGTLRLGLGYLVADLLRRPVQALGELELDRDPAGGLPRPGVHLVDAADARDRVFERLGDLGLDLARA